MPLTSGLLATFLSASGVYLRSSVVLFAWSALTQKSCSNCVKFSVQQYPVGYVVFFAILYLKPWSRTSMLT